MKKLKNLILILFTLGTLSSCNTFFKDGITGNGHVVTKEINIDSFNELEVDGVFNLVLKQGKKEAVTIEADENIAKLIQVHTERNKLVVNYEDRVSIKQSTKLNVYITVVDITRIDLNMVGDVLSTNRLNQNNVEIIKNGVGNVNLVIDCESLVIENLSVGDFTISGHSNELDITNSGVGDVLGKTFIANTVVVSNIGVGDVDIYVNKDLDVSANGVGDVNYYGNPTSKNIKDNSVGDVTARH
jgi:hypothetical protein